MTTSRQMHLAAFLLAGPAAHHHGAWWHPEADLCVFTPQWHEQIARATVRSLMVPASMSQWMTSPFQGRTRAAPKPGRHRVGDVLG